VSDELLGAYVDEDYLRSPIDDLWTFYYAAQWAAAYNSNEFSEDAEIPPRLKKLQNYFRGSMPERELATSNISDGQTEDSSEYGKFLAECTPLLRKWQLKVVELQMEWNKRRKALKQKQAEDNPYDIYYPVFREFTDRGVLELLELMEEHFGNLQ